jgi:hypothetical protein
MLNLSELSSVENPILQLLQDMQYDLADGNNEDIHNSCFGRSSTKDVLLYKQLRQALIKLNSDLSE